jgi:negative regulator of sigma E activity
MNEKKIIEELSAHLDGEATNADAIRAHLTQDTEAEQRLAAYAKISEHLQNLPVPDTHPAFVTRVMARVREEEPESRRVPAWLRFGLPLAATVLVLLAVSVVMQRSQPVPTQPPTIAQSEDPLINGILSLRSLDASALDEQESELLTAFASEESWAELSSETESDLQVASVGEEDVLTDLFDFAWSAEAEDAYTTEDVSTMLEDMDETELESFRDLLTTYAAEGSLS